MAGCSTWHARIDLVDDGAQVHARAQLIGAPASMTGRDSEASHPGCLTETGTGGDLAEWTSVPELSRRLISALANEHLAHNAAVVNSSVAVAPQG
jgi:hypothetical protein